MRRTNGAFILLRIHVSTGTGARSSFVSQYKIKGLLSVTHTHTRYEQADNTCLSIKTDLYLDEEIANVKGLPDTHVPANFIDATATCDKGLSERCAL